MVALAVLLWIGASWEETAWYLGICAGRSIAHADDFWIMAEDSLSDHQSYVHYRLNYWLPSGGEILQCCGSAPFLVQTVRVPLLVGVFCVQKY